MEEDLSSAMIRKCSFLALETIVTKASQQACLQHHMVGTARQIAQALAGYNHRMVCVGKYP